MKLWDEVGQQWGQACRFAARDENRWSERIILTAGIILGITLSALVIHYRPVSESGLWEARRLGIISRTILFCYDKTQEFDNYLISIVLTTFSGLWCWSFWALGGSGRGTSTSPPEETPPSPATMQPASSFLRRPLPSFVLLLILVALFWSPNFFHQTRYYFHFFFEEGHYFGALQEMLGGGRLYRDVFFIYGPLSLYPTYWLMLLLGPHVQWLRVQTFSLDLVAIVLVYFFLRRFTRRSLTPFLGTLLFVVLYFPDWAAPSGGLFRYFAGLIPLMLLSHFLSTQWKRWLVASGVMVGLVFFYSQEVGLCALLSVVPITFLEAWSHEKVRWTAALSRTGVVLSGAVTTLGVGALYLFGRGAGPQFMKMAWDYPVQVALGYFGLAYSDLVESLRFIVAHHDFRSLRIFYWQLEYYYPILLYLVAAVIYVTRFFKNQLGRDGLIWAGVALYGMALFRTGLARSNYLKLNWCIVPALLLVFKILDELWTGLRENQFLKEPARQRLRWSNAGAILALVAILGAYYGTAGRDAVMIFYFENAYKVEHLFGSRRPRFIPYHFRTLDFDRARGVMVPVDWYKGIEETVQFFRTETPPDEKVLVFPAGETMNFLMDRCTPTQYPTPYLSVTRAARLRMVRELDESHNRFIVYETTSWRIDALPSIVHFPELAFYIDTHYRLYRNFGGTQILLRLPRPVEKQPLVDF